MEENKNQEILDYIKKIKKDYDLPFGVSFLLPRGYDVTAIETKVGRVQYMQDKVKLVITGTISNFRVKYRGKIANIYANIGDETGSVMISWISSASAGEFKKNKLAEEFSGVNCQCIGEVSSYGEGHSKFIFLKNIKLSTLNINSATGSLKPQPIYQLKKKTKQHEIKQSIEYSIKSDAQKTSLPQEIIEKYNLPKLEDSLYFIHGLREVDSSSIGLFAESNTMWHKRIQLEMIWETLSQMNSESINKASPSVSFEKKDLQGLEEGLPFNLTISQKESLGQIFKVFKNGMFERILLQGDVGSGKTLVSIFTSYVMLKSKFNQVAVIAPSSVLANQLYEEYNEMLSKAGIYVFRSIGVVKKREKNKIQKILDKGDIPVVIIGTTSVNSFKFQKLGLLIIDEEQKMGVKAKDKLLEQLVTPHQILMSATPIPRSLAQSIFGNVKVIKIKAKPEGRLPILTKIIRTERSADNLFKFISTESNKGNKTLFVAPSINSDELASIDKLIEMCKSKLKENSFTWIHGNMKEIEIQQKIEEYKNGDFQVLLATSMVEAGFSVPDMTTVVITGPDRFGLSQLHQIRGRGGRSKGVQAYCALYPLDFNLSQKAEERLSLFSKEHDGFELSNIDLKNRGSGELIGNEQSGGGKLNFIEYAKEVAEMRKYIK